jgi:FHS family Na+ dependent glucose MFS transporter 1
MSPLIYGGNFCLIGVVLSSLGPSLEHLALNVGEDVEDLSFVFLARGAGSCIMILVGGKLSDLFPNQLHRITCVSCLALALICFAVPFVRSSLVLAVVLFSMGLASGCLDITTNVCVLRYAGAKSGPLMELTHFALGVGAACAPLVTAASLQYRNDIFGSFFFFGALACCVSAAHRYIPPPALPEAASDSTTLDTLDLSSPKASRASGSLQLSICVFLFLYVGCELAFASWIAPYIVERDVLSERDSSFVVAVFWVCMTGGRLIGAAVLSRTTAIDALLLVQLSMALGAVVLLYTMATHGGSAVVLWMVVSTAALGLSLSSIFPMVLSYCSIKGMPLAGYEVSRMMVGANLGGMIVPFVMGGLLQHLVFIVGVGIALQLCAGALMRTLSARQQLMKPSAVQGGQQQGSPGTQDNPMQIEEAEVGTALAAIQQQKQRSQIGRSQVGVATMEEMYCPIENRERDVC